MRRLAPIDANATALYGTAGLTSVTPLENGFFQPIAGNESIQIINPLAKVARMTLPSVFRGEIECAP